MVVNSVSNYPASPVYIVADEFVLRSITPSDMNQKFLDTLSNPQMLTGLNLSSFPFDINSLKDFAAQFDNLHHYFIGIFIKETKELIGFYTIDVSFPHLVGLLTGGIGEGAYEGKDVFWKTIDPLIDYFYDQGRIFKFTSRVIAHNYRMIFNFKNSTRFKLEAVLEKECVTPTGERRDVLLFSSLCDDGRRPADLSKIHATS